jgi:hypothetical protein
VPVPVLDPPITLPVAPVGPVLTPVGAAGVEELPVAALPPAPLAPVVPLALVEPEADGLAVPDVPVVALPELRVVPVVLHAVSASAHAKRVSHLVMKILLKNKKDGTTVRVRRFCCMHALSRRLELSKVPDFASGQTWDWTHPSGAAWTANYGGKTREAVQGIQISVADAHVTRRDKAIRCRADRAPARCSRERAENKRVISWLLLLGYFVTDQSAHGSAADSAERAAIGDRMSDDATHHGAGSDANLLPRWRATT